MTFYIEPKKGFIYLIYDNTNNALKIGFSKNPKSRLKYLQSATSNKLILIDYIKGNTKDEQILHNKFKGLRLSSEWFEYNSKIITEFEKLKQ